MTHASPLRPEDTKSERAEIARTVAREIADHTGEITALHLAHGSTLLRTYRPSTPRTSAWLDPSSRVRRWFGDPSVVLMIVGSLALSFMNLFLNDVPPVLQGITLAAILISALGKLVFRRVIGLTQVTADSARSRALAYADTAKDCIAVGTTHVSWREHGTWIDRTRIVPHTEVEIVNLPHRISLHDRKARTLMVIDRPIATSAFHRQSPPASGGLAIPQRGFGRRLT